MTDAWKMPASRFFLGVRKYKDATGRFTVISQLPDAPTLLSPAANAIIRQDQSNNFSWTFSDPTRVGATQSAYALKRRNLLTNVEEWWNASTSSWSATEVYNSTSTQNVSLAANTWSFYAATPYAWTVATKNDINLAGPYAAERPITVTIRVDPTITSPGTVTTANHTMTWTVSSQSAFQARLLQGATVIADSGKVYSRTTRSYLLGQMANGVSYTFEITTWNDDDFPSAVVTTAKTPSYTQPSVPTVVGSTPAGRPLNRLVITNPGGGDTVVRNEVWRSLTGVAGSYVRIASTVALNGTYDDYAVGAGVSYWYFVRAIGTSDTIRDSAVV
jgi:hypothetical protein